ncbi:MAG: 16S rRNA (adenine1518-N6/adenine1519-N6)-dimethyltransferase, partial [Saprospiraceae bacterium]
MRAKKSFGQNFLIDESVCRHIVDRFVEDNPCDKILEVGPGRGAITKYLIQQEALTFKGVEADRDMVHHLQQTFGLGPDQLIQEDFLKLPLDEIYEGEYAVIGNFPYNISSQILFHVDKYKETIPFALGMFQKEVAQRLASGPGTKIYGVISVLLQATYDIELLFEVPPESFQPAPKVT